MESKQIAWIRYLSLNCIALLWKFQQMFPSECTLSYFLPQSAASFSDMESPSSSYEKPQAFEACECLLYIYTWNGYT